MNKKNILIGVLLLIIAVGIAYFSGMMSTKLTLEQQAGKDAGAAVQAADTAAMSARAAADSTKKTSVAAEKSARDAANSAKDSQMSANRSNK